MLYREEIETLIGILKRDRMQEIAAGIFTDKKSLLNTQIQDLLAQYAALKPLGGIR